MRNKPRIIIWSHLLFAAVPFISAIATAFMWADTRYMHKDISDTRFIELQIKIVEGHIRDYNRVLDSGGQLNAEEQVKYELDKKQLMDLMAERNRILGIGELPQ